MLRDALGRSLTDLRVSVTDRCNLRCTYCMPRAVFGPDHVFLPRAELLTFEEIARIVRAGVALGVRKVRLTGGEPLLRRALDDLVAALAAIPAIDDLALTTNGVLLPGAAPTLARAGLRRVTVSLDALDEATFRAMADTPLPVTRVLDGIDAALAAGLGVKLNAVVRRGVNEHAIRDLAAFGRDREIVVRFIEYMDVGTSNGWRLDEVVPAEEILAVLAASWPLEPVDGRGDAGVAERFRYVDGGGEVGVIASVTRPFCRTCVRARLSAVGELYTCLFTARGHDLRAVLRGGASDDDLRAELARLWGVRDDRWSEERDDATGPRPKVEMSYIGG